ncbi:zinc finger CCCH-type with G patch domain-containing protein isoform X2 [Macrosteles quadrilineatus]|uniref:zinc finger CCCH-type with G patch domain-containing protein isoform X2 n=1 Tax=Macrosteles quadrilineatus TaxID=74068 RepID=UPI0023E28099|nr:zinc finger CCCH-type with G patch domain-containing protein isoform X2 [Macrosteles quadrilineatus]
MDKAGKSLQQKIDDYETQLSQIKRALSLTESEEERGNLLCLEKDLTELISLTRETLNTIQKSPKNEPNPSTDDPFSAEYALFRAELAELEEDITSNNPDALEPGTSSISEENLLQLQEEILALKGTKCQAPYSHHWQRADTSSSSDSQGYHNALIIDVETPKVAEDLSLIQVRVLFVNPTEKQMCPCPFYLEGKCKFSDEKCNYSHGEIVPFSDIREYKEPDFSLVREGAPILAKQKDSLWHRARVKQIVDDSKVRVQFETNSHNTVEMDLHDVLPLCGVAGSDNSSSDSDSDSDDSNNTEVEAPVQEDVFMRMTTTAPSTKLGEWEKHTKGIGSRLMANMGYVVGCGLGKRGEGRIEPVEATAYPPGKSLDMCMALREAAGGDPDMFKAEKRQRKQQQKLLQLQKKLKEREEFRTDVFTFLNDKLAGKTDAKPKASHQILASSSSKGLAVERFQLAENIKKKQKDIGKLKESLKRHESGSLAHKAITNKIKDAQSDLGVLQNNDTMIAREQGQRDNRKKMAVF